MVFIKPIRSHHDGKRTVANHDERSTNHATWGRREQQSRIRGDPLARRPRPRHDKQSQFRARPPRAERERMTNEANFRTFQPDNGGRGGKQSQFAFPAGMGDVGAGSSIGKLALAAATPRRKLAVRNKANFVGGEMAISDSNESGYAKKRVLWRRENKANSQNRDCRVASLLAMTGRGREPIVPNKANSRSRRVWAMWARRYPIGKLARAAATRDADSPSRTAESPGPSCQTNGIGSRTLPGSPGMALGLGPGGGGFCGEVRHVRKARRRLDLAVRGGILSGRFGQGRSERGHNAACS